MDTRLAGGTETRWLWTQSGCATKAGSIHRGHEHSTQLHIVERIRRIDAETLEIERTFSDPIALAKPFTMDVVLKLSPDKDLDDNINGGYDCTQFMMRKPAFGEGIGGVMGISEPPAGEY